MKLGGWSAVICTKPSFILGGNDYMPNKYEQRLYQIEILLHAYKTGDGSYDEEIQVLQDERDNILQELNRE